jgi:hypothetical protein
MLKEVPPQDPVEIDPVDALAAVEVGAVGQAAAKENALAADGGCDGDLITTALVASVSITKTSTY